MSEPKKTPLAKRHEELGGKMVDFSGWYLPVQYPTGIIAEHNNTRNEVSVFDVSHMGEILVEGEGAEAFVQSLVTNDVSKIHSGRAVYSPMCYENGTCVDDLIVYPWKDGNIFIVVNAANDDKDYEWIKSHAPAGVKVTHLSDKYGQIALQGPKAKDVMEKIGLADANALKFFGAGFFTLCGVECIISKTGYTGEKGFEIYMPAEKTVEIWNLLLDAGAKPAGLGARDTLRFEACLPLYGHEISDTIRPDEANLGFFIKPDTHDFIGKEALLATPPARKQIGLDFKGRGVARNGFPVYANGKQAGYVTTGSPSPTTGKTLALAIIDAATPDDAAFAIEVRGKLEPAEKLATPFYKNSK
ncbi:MAG: glycine cleavage system aminomethyltransferase GcvT [Clostridia bacterium]|nr:glycine cleavage system aminomethyltransferase GcvT [Clostridia bacterium]